MPEFLPGVTNSRLVSPLTITNNSWMGGNGYWSNTANWSLGAVPTSNNDVLITNPTASTVTLDINGQAYNLSVSSGNSLNFNNNTTLTVSVSSISNAGIISLNSSGYTTELQIGSSSVTLSGGGTVTMSNNVNNLISGSAPGDKFTNQETISGSGNIGGGQTMLVNSGTINANQSNQLTIATGTWGTTNTGSLEATSNGTLGFTGTTVTNTGGTINTSGGGFSGVSTTINGGTVTLAGGYLGNSTINDATVTVAGSSDLQLYNGSFTNGTLKNSAELETLYGSFSNMVGGTVTNTATGLIKIDNNSGLTLQSGTYSNAGTISLNSTGNSTQLVIDASNITLGGGGTISLSNNVNNLIYGASSADTLTSQETIEGAGNIGDGQMTLVNSGTINANQSNALTIAASGGTTNTGTLEATSNGTLGFNGTTVTNTGGTINTSGGGFSAVSTTINGGAVTLAGGYLGNSTINDATVTVAGSSDLELYNGSFTNGTLKNSAELETLYGSFSNMVGGTVTNTATGLIKIDNNSGLTLQSGTYSNAGTISLNSTGNSTQLVIDASNITLGGGGTISLSNNVNNLIYGASSADTLTNQETITGSGNIGDGQMTLVNSGTINANQSNALTIAASGGTTNTGALEATSGGTLGFSGTTVTDTVGTINTSGGGFSAVSTTINGGTITLAGGYLGASTINDATVTVAGSSDLQLYNGSFTNGTLKNSAELETLYNSFGNTLGGTVTNTAAGMIKIDNNSALTLQSGTYSNAGTISLNSTGNSTQLVIASNITLGGGGTISLSNNVNNLIFGASSADTLTNQETIAGSGNIGNGQMTLVNSGTINANQPTALTIAANGGTTNTGTLEATSNGTLGFNGTTVTNTGGTINTSNGSISAVNATINGGTITLAGGYLGNSNINDATVTVAGSSDLQLYNGSFTNGTLKSGAELETLYGSFGNTVGGTVTNTASGVIKIDNNSGLTLQSGTYSNAGAISLNSTGNSTQLVIGASNITLGGGGTINLSNNVNNLIFGASSADKLTNQETIEGSGNIGNGQMTLANSGTINANQSNSLTIAANGGTTNYGTLEATSNGTLGFNGTTVTNIGNSASINTSGGGFSGVSTTINGGTVTLAGGYLGNSTINDATVTVAGSSDLQLYNGSFTNGTLKNSAELETLYGSFSNTVGGTVTNAASGLIKIDNNSGLTLQSGTYSNAGTISLNSTGNSTQMVIDSSNITLGGGGTISLSNNVNNLIYGASSADKLTNQETIEGAGNIGDGQMTLANSGTINANQPNALTIAASGGTTNYGTLEATGNGTLGFNGTTVTNTGISATINTSSGSFSAVNSTINGGTVTLAGGYLGNSTINDATVTVAGSSDLQLYNGLFTNGTLKNSAELETLYGSFGNTVGNNVTNTASGLIKIDNNSGLTLQSGTYSNAGTISLNSTGNSTQLVIDASNITLGGGGTISLSNNANNLIFGASSADTLTNQETIAGSGNIGDGQMTLVNSGTINANQPTALTIAASGGFTNSGALTVGSGSTLQITTATPFENFSGTTLTGGTYNVGGTLQFGVSGTKLVTNDANITLTGSSSQIIDSAGNNVLTTFAANGSSGSFALEGGRNFTTAGNFTNNGALTVGSGSTFSVDGSLVNFSGTTLTGGTYNIGGTLQFGASGTSLVANGSNITLYGSSSQIIDAGGNNILRNFAVNASTGSFTLGGGRNFTTVGNFTNNGSLTVGSGSTFSVNGNLANFSSGTLAGGTYNVGGTLQFNGANIVTNSANLTLTGTSSRITDQTGTLNALANFATNSAAGIFTLSGNQNLTVAGNFTNVGSLTVATGSTFGLSGGGTYTQTGGSTVVNGTLKSSVTTADLNLTQGSLFGAGTLGFSLMNSGVLTPGNSSASTSLLDVSGSYKQNSGGALDISIAGTIAGTSYDQLKVTGAATVGGTLNLKLLNGYVPAVGTTFDILTSSSVSGTFATVNGAINSTEHFSVSCSGDNCDATVVSGAAVTHSVSSSLAVSHLASVSLTPSLLPGSAAGGAMSSASLPAFNSNGHSTASFQTPSVRMMPYRLPALASSPLAPGNARKYKGVQFGVEMLSLFRTSPRTLLRGLAGSAEVPAIGYVNSMPY